MVYTVYSSRGWSEANGLVKVVNSSSPLTENMNLDINLFPNNFIYTEFEIGSTR